MRTMKYCIITYGCQMNESDSEKIAARLEHQGHKPAKNEEAADLIVLNCCSVRQAAMHRVYDKINKYSGKKKIILAGCILPKDKKMLKEKIGAIWHPDEYFECSPPHTASLRGAPLPAGQRGNPEQLPPSPHSAPAYVPIMTGCNNFCSYCAVPFTRGHEKSRPAEEVINEVKSLIKNGAKEIMLLGQNVNSYSDTSLRGGAPCSKEGAPTKQSRANTSVHGIAALPPVARNDIRFPTLLKLINALPGNFRLSFLTSHPKDMSDGLIATMAKCEKLTKELHLPIQSGDNTILRKMNRQYTTAHYKNLIKKIRRAMPDIKISTDIIVGFPGETKKQFQNTIKLAKAIKFNGAFIAKYSPRPGTAAARLKDNVPTEEKKRRWKILDTLINKFEH